MCYPEIALKYLSRRGIHEFSLSIWPDLWLWTGNGIRSLQGWDRRFGYFPWLGIEHDWNNMRISNGRWEAQLLSIIPGAGALISDGRDRDILFHLQAGKYSSHLLTHADLCFHDYAFFIRLNVSCDTQADFPLVSCIVSDTGSDK